MSIIPNLILGATLASYTILETFTFEVEEKTIIHPDIPANFSGVRIAYVSDIHHGVFVRKKHLAKITKKIKQFEPHLLLMGGDYIQSKLTQKKQLECVENVFAEFRKIPTSLGKYGVLGNHDHDEVGATATLKAMHKNGFRDLDNQAVWIWKGFQRIRLGGVGDLWYNKQDLQPTIKPISAHDYTILLSHQPGYVDQLGNAKIDLMLTGHTHGGQSLPIDRLPFNIGKSSLRKERVKGWVKANKTQLLISCGIGLEFPFIRFLNQPQIHIITLKKGLSNQVVDTK